MRVFQDKGGFIVYKTPAGYISFGHYILLFCTVVSYEKRREVTYSRRSCLLLTLLRHFVERLLELGKVYGLQHGLQ